MWYLQSIVVHLNQENFSRTKKRKTKQEKTGKNKNRKKQNWKKQNWNETNHRKQRNKEKTLLKHKVLLTNKNDLLVKGLEKKVK